MKNREDFEEEWEYLQYVLDVFVGKFPGGYVSVFYMEDDELLQRIASVVGDIRMKHLQNYIPEMPDHCTDVIRYNHILAQLRIKVLEAKVEHLMGALMYAPGSKAFQEAQQDFDTKDQKLN